MPVYFAFSDESGKYKKERTDKFISKNPYYCRSVVLVEADEWIKLRKEFSLLKKRLLEVGIHQEVKWSYIWSLYKHFQKKEKIPQKKPYYPLRHHSLDTLVDFIRKALRLLQKSETCRIFLTLTFNEKQKTQPIDLKTIIRQHLKHALDLAEKETAKIPQSVCVFFLSPEETRLERLLKGVFTEIYGGVPSLKYSHIKDSLNFEVSPHSFGSQMADYCAGVFSGCCRLYPQSIDLFRHQIWPKILKEKNKVLGHGITEIPKNPKNRDYLEGILEKIFAAQDKDYRISLEQRLKSKK